MSNDILFVIRIEEGGFRMGGRPHFAKGVNGGAPDSSNSGWSGQAWFRWTRGAERKELKHLRSRGHGAQQCCARTWIADWLALKTGTAVPCPYDWLLNGGRHLVLRRRV